MPALSGRCLGRRQEKSCPQPHHGNKEITQQALPIKTCVKGMQSMAQSGKQLEGQGQQSLTCAMSRDLGLALTPNSPAGLGAGRWAHCLPLPCKLPAGFPCPTESSSKCHSVGVCKRTEVAPTQHPWKVELQTDELRHHRVSPHTEPVQVGL